MKRILEGLLIGIGKIIPGVSGSVIAISLGVYEHAINSINHFFDNIKDNFKYLFSLAIGILISIIFCSKIVINLLNNYYVPTILFFIGLIIGGSSEIIKNSSKKYALLTIISCLIVLMISLITNSKEITFNNYFLEFLTFIFIGFIDAVCMIIPGISGTAILMMLGCYKLLMNVLSNLTNISQIIDNLLIILPFSIGLLIGVVLTIKLVSYLFKNHYTKTYNVIFGFLIASIIYMFKTTLTYKYTLNQVIIGLFLFIIGYKVTKKIG